MPKTRLTITLSQDLLDRVDALINKKTIRNRSHAIEEILAANLKPTITTAIILAGGAKKSPAELHHSLTPIAGQPLILHTLRLLKQHGISRVIITTTSAIALKKVISAHPELGLKIEYQVETHPLGTAGAISQAAKDIAQPFLVMAGDVFTTINLTELIQFHHQARGLVTMAVKPRSAQKNFDNAFIQGHTIVDFQPSTANQAIGIVNTGIYVIEPAALAYLPQPTNQKPIMLEQDLFPVLAKQGKLMAFTFQGPWFDIATDSSYQQAVQAVT